MAKKKSTSKKNQKKKNTDITGIILLAVSLVLAISIYTNAAGYLSFFSKRFFISSIGVGTYILPIYMIYLSIIYISSKGVIKLSKSFIAITVAIINTLIFIQVMSIESYYDKTSFFNSLKAIIYSQNYFHSGIIGFTITLPIYKLIGSIGTFIVNIAIYIIVFIIGFDFSLDSINMDLGFLQKKSVKNNEKPKQIEKKDDFLVIEEKNPDQNEFINGINNKIKILDFMKNASVHEEVMSESAPTKVEITDNTISTPNTTTTSDKKKGLDNEVKEVVNKELTERLLSADDKEYIIPSTELLNVNSALKLKKEDKKELLLNATKLEETLNSFGVDAKIVQVTKGPSVTRFELQPSAGVKVSKIVNLSDDIALGLAANGVRIEAPIPGKAAVGIEVPNKELTPVMLREVLDSDEFINTKTNLAFALGKDIAGKAIVADLSKMPHLLIAGATGSGKSVCINTLIISILYKYSPSEVKLLMVDPKVVELNVYNGIPQLLIPVVTDPKKAAAALNWAVNEMTRRYKLFADSGVRNIESYNNLFDKGIITEKLPWIVIIVDELADLMMACPNDVEDYIARLAQMARAAGMHLVIATQRPSVDVITGVIKANIPSRISFAVSSQIDSRTILDSSGAEKLLGKGDMLFYPVGASKPVRIQGAFISEEEVEQVINFIKGSSEETSYETEIIEHINSEVTSTSTSNPDDGDELLDEAIRIVVETGQASTSFLQRKLRVGFNRAARIMEQLEENNIISPKDGSKPRQVLISKEELENM
ncbi:cell division protein FtsK [Clostridium sp. YIM B02505]|uniref:Cell division protein FtsK n=1 Tax=Clostridium yunnanense TaxID=2800325 RepID=A0ABS1EMS8_9CLOT|nr:DNA translocase FtsK [Clostridium yunnanense]MBK1810677.1 cell division protein FtsK [Clostridium yunnanense]